MRIGPFSHEEFMEEARRFHGYAAPGLIIGGYMVELARSHMPAGVLYDAVSETTYCLPDAIQMLTPCTFGNGWLRVLNLGLYAMSLFDKRNGNGVRVHLDADKVDQYPAIKEWFLKLKPKKEQDTDQLQEEIYEAGIAVLTAQPIQVKPHILAHRSKGDIVRCAICGEPHPASFGTVCRSCQGESPYEKGPGMSFPRGPQLVSIPVEQAVGKTALHDMTRIEPGVFKGVEIMAGQIISGGDLCRLQAMGRNSVYVTEGQGLQPGFVHENDVAQMFAGLVPGPGVAADSEIREGKVNLVAQNSGLLWIDLERLNKLNHITDLVLATRHQGGIVDKDDVVAAGRSIPLYFPQRDFLLAQSLLGQGPLISVLPMRKAKIGLLITGTEVFQGLIEDKFEPIIRQKIQSLNCEISAVVKVPDDLDAIIRGVDELLRAGADLIITTAGLSVDPDDVTRRGLIQAGLSDFLYGAPLLPGAMTLIGKISNENGAAQVLGVPACALYHKTTSLDVMLPYLLANAPLTREIIDNLGHGGLCHNCKTCTYPKCWFAK